MARAIYPVSSNIEMKKNNIKMLGKKTSTPPTPAMMPSTMRSRKIPSFIHEPTNSPSHDTADSIHSCGYAPMVNVAWNMSQTKKIKIGKPNHLLVRKSSALYAWFLIFFAPFLYVSFNAPLMKA